MDFIDFWSVRQAAVDTVMSARRVRVAPGEYVAEIKTPTGVPRTFGDAGEAIAYIETEASAWGARYFASEAEAEGMF